MRAFIRRLASRSVRQLTRLAAALAITGLLITAYSILSPRPVPVILAMSLGHVFAVGALLAYILAVVLDTSRAEPAPDSLAPRRAKKPAPPADEPSAE